MNSRLRRIEALKQRADQINPNGDISKHMIGGEYHEIH